jgi:hypothetical protein
MSHEALVEQREQRLSTKIIAIGLLLIALLSVAVALNHPEPATRNDTTATALANIAGQSRAIFSVHATLIILMILTAVGMNGLTRKLGRESHLTMAAMAMMALSMLSMSMAALVNGFAVPMWASAYPVPLTVESDAAARAILMFASSLNRVFANAAVLLSSFSLLFFGITFAAKHGTWRLVGGLGCLIGLGTLVGLLSGAFVLDYDGFNLTNAGFYIWVGAFAGHVLFAKSEQSSISGSSRAV